MFSSDSNDGNDDEFVSQVDSEEASSEPLRSEVKWAIKGLKIEKSPGCDEISAEFIKAAREAGVDVYWTLCKKSWRSGIWPSDWKRAVFIPLPKKGDQ